MLRIAEVSDVHLLHPRTPTKHILENLRRCINDKLLCNIDILVIAGDLFDREGSFSDPNVHLCIRWMAELLQMVNRHNVWLYVLEGTPSHDRKQSLCFSTLLDAVFPQYSNPKINYITELNIVHNPEFNIDILFVPDEVHYDTFTTRTCVQEQLHQRGISQVDYAVMHGIFDFQVPEVIKAHIKHDSEFYLSIVRHLIFIGHDHSPQVRGRIAVSGSFDRLSHNEEHKKGMVRAIVEDDGEFVFEFIENKYALPYVTIHVRGQDTEDIFKSIAKKVEKLPEGAHVRILTEAGNSLLVGLKQLAQINPTLNWKVETKEKKKVDPIRSDVQQKKQALIVNEQTVNGLLQKRLRDKSVPQLVIDRVNHKLDLIR